MPSILRAFAATLLAVLAAACAAPAPPSVTDHPAPPIAGQRYIADPVSGTLGSPDQTLRLPDGAQIAFTDAANKKAFQDNGARYQLAAEQRIGFKMYDPVARFPRGVRDPALGELVVGSQAYPYVYADTTYVFASDANRQAFARDPKSFIAGVGGYCLNAMRHQNTAMVIGDPHNARFIGGLWYTFGGTEGPGRWDKVPAAEKAGEVERAWAFYFGQVGEKARDVTSLR
jgi:YHS domain-containing protein